MKLLGLEVKSGHAAPYDIWLCSPNARGIFSNGDNGSPPQDAFLGAVLKDQPALAECRRLLEEESADILGERLGFMRDAYWVLGRNVIDSIAREAA